MNEMLDLTRGLQCCLRCGRILTDRVLHDAVEDAVLASIRAGHPEWVGTDEVCTPCIKEYHNLLNERQTRSLWLREAEQRRWTFRLGRWFERRFFSASQA